MRNPRIDPMPGDVLIRRHSKYPCVWVKRKISTVDEQFVVAHEEHQDGFKRIVYCYTCQWRKWAAKADVFEQQEETAA